MRVFPRAFYDGENCRGKVYKMAFVLDFLKMTISVVINALSLAMLARAILSWFDPMQEWGINGFLHVITEPIILPIRALCERMNWFQGVPIDIPFLITFILLSVVDALLMAL